MSTLATTNLKNPDAVVNSFVFNADGSVTVSGSVTFISGYTSDIAPVFGSGFISSGNVTLNGQSSLRFGDTDSSNWVAFQAPSVVTGNVTWTLPDVIGGSGTFLSTDGAGNLSWGTPSSSGTQSVISVGGQTGVVTYADTWAVGTSASAISNATLDVSGSYVNNVVALGTGTVIDCSSGNYFTATLSGNYAYTVTNVPSGRSYSFALELETITGSVTWPSGTQWPDGISPSLYTTKTSLIVFITDDNGARWRAAALTNYTT